MSFYVTTPIYYVNGEPHLGHAYSTIAADILARHHRQRGEDVFFLTGTDEHGEPVAQQAEAEGVTPRELGDRLAPRFKEMAAKINASNDFFIRTTDEGHMERVQEIVQRVYDNGHVYEGMYEGWYCPRCADFKTESEIGPDNTCPIHKIPLTREEQKNWFFRLSSFQEPLERLYEERPDFVVPAFRKNEALSFIKQGLQDVSLSRKTLKWGVPVPWDSDQVIYVWFDALLNYYTALGYGVEGEDVTEKFWPPFHILAKDILKFHAVYWPAFLMAADIELPTGMFIHGFLLMEGHKMSKSLGNVLDPDQVIAKFGADALRFYCFREVSFGQDGQISPAGFESRYETELADQYGNLANRVLSMIGRYRDGVVPEAGAEPELRRRSRGCSGAGARPPRRRGAHPGSRGDLEAGQAAQPVRRGDEAVGALEGRVGGGAPRFRALWPGRGPPYHHPAAPRLHAGDDRPPARSARGAVPRAGRFRLPGRGSEARRAGPALPEARARLGIGRPEAPW